MMINHNCCIKLVPLVFYSYGVGRYIESLRAGRSGDRISVWARFSAPVETGPGAHPTSYTIGTGSLSRGANGRGLALTTHPHLAPRLKKE